jgi:hypothetical protein
MPDYTEKETGETGLPVNDRNAGNVSLNGKEAGEQQLSAEDRYVKNVLWQRKVVMDALNNGKLACLPNERGFADTQPAVNLINNTTYNGTTFLYLKEVQRQQGFPTAEFVTREQIEKAGEARGKQAYIERGQKGITIPYKERDKTTGEWEPKHQTLYNIAQLTNPEVVRSYAREVQQEKERNGRAWAEQNGKTLRAPWHENEVQCTSSEPKEYLGQYLTAVSFGARFKVSRGQAAEFTGKTEKLIFEPSQTGKPNPMNLLKLSNEAGAYSKEFRSRIIEGRTAAARETRQVERETGAKERQGRKAEEAAMGY